MLNAAMLRGFVVGAEPPPPEEPNQEYRRYRPDKGCARTVRNESVPAGPAGRGLTWPVFRRRPTRRTFPHMRTPTFLLLLAPLLAGAQTPSIATATQGLERHDGFVPFYLDDGHGKVLFEIGTFDQDFLYLTSLATGIGSLDLGIDRGEIGSEYLARFERVGPRVHLVPRNPTFRARTDNAALARSVEESFPVSVVASLEITGETEGRVVVDATGFLVSDVMDVVGRLRRADQGTFRVERERSGVHAPRTRAFPRNTEVEAVLTFAGDNPGAEVRRHTPDGRALTLREHHSFVRLPDAGYQPRAFDPRAGYFALSFWDFARGFAEDYPTR